MTSEEAAPRLRGPVRFVAQAALLCTACLCLQEGVARAELVPNDSKRPPGPRLPQQDSAISRPDFVAHRWELDLGLGVVTTVLLLSGNALPQISRAGYAPDSGYAPYRAGPDQASEITGAAIGAAIGLSAGSVLEAVHLTRGGRADEFWYSTLVATEAWLLSASATLFLKKSIGRCRPVAWDETAGQCEPTLPAQDPESTFFAGDTAYRAMPSGHVTGISGVSGAYLWLALASKEPAPLRWTAFGVTQALAWTTGLLRVEAGVHSWSDVAVAWAMGTGIGIGVAALHPRAAVRPRAASLRIVPLGAGLSLRGQF